MKVYVLIRSHLLVICTGDQEKKSTDELSTDNETCTDVNVMTKQEETITGKVLYISIWWYIIVIILI